MKVFLAVTSLLGTYGGPAFSVSQLATALAAAGARVALWAPDGSAMTSDLVTSGIERLDGDEAAALDLFGSPDVIHDNGIWLPHNHRLSTEAHRRAVVRVVSTRGMLEPWAINHKRWKKRLAWRLYQRRDLMRAAMLHATAPAEAVNLARLNLSPPVHTIANGINAVEVQLGRKSGAQTALFVGRLYPVKGLPMLVEAWSRVRPEGWKMNFVGPDEAGHRSQLEALIAAAGLQEEMSFSGLLTGREKANAFANADLAILPSHSESFGMAVGEALAHGLPVLATEAVPWPTLESAGCGWRVETSVAGLVEGLQRATSTPPLELAAMGQLGRKLVAEQFSWSAAAACMLDLYAAAHSQGVRP